MREIIFQIRGGKSQEEWGFSENQGKCKLFFLICIDLKDERKKHLTI